LAHRSCCVMLPRIFLAVSLLFLSGSDSCFSLMWVFVSRLPSSTGRQVTSSSVQGKNCDEEFPQVPVPLTSKLLSQTCRLRARVSYNGTYFHGVQKNTVNGNQLRTILSELETSLSGAFEQNIRVIAAGRTDAGVSASGQVVAFDATIRATPLEPESGSLLQDSIVSVQGIPTSIRTLSSVLNKHFLPSDLQINELMLVDAKFDVVGDCRWKRYRYSLPSPSEPDYEPLVRVVTSHAARAARKATVAFDRSTSDSGDGATRIRRPRRPSRGMRSVPQLINVTAMAEAAKVLEGTQDFAAFQARGSDQATTVRTIYKCVLCPRQVSDGVDIVIEGDGFLYKMVRIIAGTLVMAGLGLATPDTVRAALNVNTPEHEAGGEFAGLVGPTLSAKRLCLEHVEYDSDWND